MSSEANGTLEEIPKMLNNIEESNTQLNSLIDSLTEKIKSGQLGMNEVSTVPIQLIDRNKACLVKCPLTDYWLFHVRLAHRIKIRTTLPTSN